jgi:hypothetical protein
LSWSIPTQNDDGSPLTDLAGYRIYYGLDGTVMFPDQMVEIPVAQTEAYTLELTVAAPTTYYFRITAYDTSGNESEPSERVSKEIRFIDTQDPGEVPDFKVSMKIRVVVDGGELVHP